MMDCNTLGSMPQILSQGSSEASSPVTKNAPAAAGNEQTDFSSMVEDKHGNDESALEKDQETELDMDKREEEVTETKWMANFLYLTQKVQKSERLEIERFSQPGDNETKTINFNALSKNSAHLETKKKQDFDTRLKMSLPKEMTARLEGQERQKAKDEKTTKQALTMLQKTAAFEKATHQEAVSDKTLSLPYGKGIALENESAQGGVVNRLESSHSNLQTQKQLDVMVVGEKTGLGSMPEKTAIKGADTIDMIDHIEIIRTRKQAGVTSLQLQLKPDNLGTVEAKLRLEKDHLRVELMTSTPQAAKILEKDQDLLRHVLEKAGFDHKTRLSLSIIERNGSSVQPVLASSMQEDAASSQMSHDHASNKGERSLSDGALFSQEKENKQNATGQDSRNEKSVQDLSPLSADHEENASRSSRRLVV